VAKTKISKLKSRRKAPAKPARTYFAIASVDTIWAIATNWAAGLVTFSIHTNGRLPTRKAPIRFLFAAI
jgi:hypothetical protein